MPRREYDNGSADQTWCRIGEVAGRKLDLVTHEELRRAGLGAGAIKYRSGRTLHPVFRRVYKYGSPVLRPNARELAAALSFGPRARVNDMSAARVMEILRGYDGPLHVTLLDRQGRSREGIEVHHNELLPAEHGQIGPIPITSPERTLLDIACGLDRQALDRAVNQALFLRLTTYRALAGYFPRGRATPALPPCAASSRRRGE